MLEEAFLDDHSLAIALTNYSGKLAKLQRKGCSEMTVSQQYDKRSMLFYLQDGGARGGGESPAMTPSLGMTLILNKSFP